MGREHRSLDFGELHRAGLCLCLAAARGVGGVPAHQISLGLGTECGQCRVSDQNQRNPPSPGAAGLLCHGKHSFLSLECSSYILIHEMQHLCSARIFLAPKTQQFLFLTTGAASATSTRKCCLFYESMPVLLTLKHILLVRINPTGCSQATGVFVWEVFSPTQNLQKYF